MIKSLMIPVDHIENNSSGKRPKSYYRYNWSQIVTGLTG
jgi:hypothetical protein